MRTRPYKELRWVLRGFSGIIILFFLLMFVGETFFGENPETSMTTSEIIQLSIAGIGLIGLGLAWKWELIGGITATATFVVLAIINPSVLEAPLLLIWPFTGILFIVLWAVSRGRSLRNK